MPDIGSQFKSSGISILSTGTKLDNGSADTPSIGPGALGSVVITFNSGGFSAIPTSFVCSVMSLGGFQLQCTVTILILTATTATCRVQNNDATQTDTFRVFYTAIGT